MLSLIDLPREILIDILRFAGTEGWLLARTERLLICRTWYDVARLVMFDDVVLTRHALAGYVGAPTHIQDLLNASVRHLSIKSSPVDGSAGVSISTNQDEKNADSNFQRLARAEALIKLTGSSLERFAPHLSEMPRLLSFCFRSQYDSDQFWRDPTLWSKALAATVQSLPPSLTHLTIDAPSDHNMSFFRPASVTHLCPLLLSSRLPSLRHLRLRIPEMCVGLFPEAVPGHQSQLRTLVINMNMSDDASNRSFRARHCPDPNHLMYAVRVRMEKGGMDSKASLPHLKNLRFIHTPARKGLLYSADIISRQCFGFSDDIPWDDIDRIDSNPVDYPNEPLEADEFDMEMDMTDRE